MQPDNNSTSFINSLKKTFLGASSPGKERQSVADLCANQEQPKNSKWFLKTSLKASKSYQSRENWKGQDLREQQIQKSEVAQNSMLFLFPWRPGPEVFSRQQRGWQPEKWQLKAAEKLKVESQRQLGGWEAEQSRPCTWSQEASCRVRGHGRVRETTSGGLHPWNRHGRETGEPS